MLLTRMRRATLLIAHSPSLSKIQENARAVDAVTGLEGGADQAKQSGVFAWPDIRIGEPLLYPPWVRIPEELDG
jgi:hypothetical protein